MLEVSDRTSGIGSQNGGFDDWTTNNHRWSTSISNDWTANTNWQNDVFGFNRPPTLVFVRWSMSTRPSTLIAGAAPLIIKPQASVVGVETSNIGYWHRLLKWSLSTLDCRHQLLEWSPWPLDCRHWLPEQCLRPLNRWLSDQMGEEKPLCVFEKNIT